MPDSDTRRWHGFDLDGTLAQYPGPHPGMIGEPVKAIFDILTDYLAEGKRCKIFTARCDKPEQLFMVRDWLDWHGLGDLEITNVKDLLCEEIWDDRAVAVEHNTGMYFKYGNHKP